MFILFSGAFHRKKLLDESVLFETGINVIMEIYLMKTPNA